MHLESQATTYENNQRIIHTRKQLYGAWDKDSWKARIAQIKTDNPKETE
jgi:hypothetical protein